MAERGVSSSESTSDENEGLEGRRARIKELIKNIGSKKKGKKATSMKAKKEEPVAKPLKRKRGQGRYTEYKIQIGWLHYRNERDRKGKNKEKYTQVTARKGGGIRTFHYPKDEPQTVEHLIQYGKSVFFPDGKNERGNVSEMEVKLSTHNGNVIEHFVNNDGAECSLQEYLKCMGIYSSQFFVYLRTRDLSEISCTSDCNDGEQKQTPENSLKVADELGNGEQMQQKNPEQSFQGYQNKCDKTTRDATGIVVKNLENITKYKVNGISPPEIYVRYTKGIKSGFTEEQSFLNNFSIEDCYMFTSTCNMDKEIERENFNPLDYGYKVTAVNLNENIFLDLKEVSNNNYEFEYPSAPPESSDSVILHTPGQIFGVERSNSNPLVLGVIIKPHNSGAFFSWFRDDEPHASGIDLCIVPVKIPGLYNVHVSVNSGQTLYICPHVEVLYAMDACSRTSLSQTSEPHDQVLHAMESTTSLSQTSEPHDQVLHAMESTTSLGQTSEPHDQVLHAMVSTTSLSQTSEPHDQVLHAMESTTSLSQTSEPHIQVLHAMESTTSLSQTSEPHIQVLHAMESTTSLSQTSEPHVQVPYVVDCKSHTQTSEVLGVAHNSFLDQKHSCTDQSKPVGYQESLVPHIPISDITLGDMIGQGAFGKVYKGEWLGTTVAVKEMLVKRINIVKPMIEREMNVHSRIRHPYIVQLMAVAVSKNKLYLVTEYVDGSNLDDVIFCRESSEAVSPLCKLEIAQKIVQAVTYLHNQCPPIIHRDIKPENILVSRDLSIVRLCDMGLSKLKSLNTLITTMASSSEMQPGTPAYQPPEVLVHKRKANVQSDIWSLSCTLLELFAEVPTWDLDMDGDDLQCIVERMKEKRRPDGVSKLVGKVNVPMQVVDTIVKGLDYDPEKRPSSMSILKSIQ